MTRYPGYTAEDALNEYATRFFVLLEQATRLEAREALNQIRIASFPHQKAVHQKKTISDYQKQAHGKTVLTPAIIERDSNRLMTILGIKQK